jgi:hypothetical protein
VRKIILEEQMHKKYLRDFVGHLIKNLNSIRNPSQFFILQNRGEKKENTLEKNALCGWWICFGTNKASFFFNRRKRGSSMSGICVPAGFSSMSSKEPLKAIVAFP